MSSLICLDTHVLIWGIKEQATPGQEDMIPKAANFLSYIDNNDKYKVMIPAVVLGELFMNISPDTHQMTYNLLSRGGFIIQPYDNGAASAFGKLWQECSDQGIIEQVRNQYDIPRNYVKADLMIVGTAIANNATCIYSEDGPMKKLAEGHILVKDIPEIEISEQMELFDSPDSVSE